MCTLQKRAVIGNRLKRGRSTMLVSNNKVDLEFASPCFYIGEVGALHVAGLDNG